MFTYLYLALDPLQEKRDSGKTLWLHFPFLDCDLPGCRTYRERRTDQKISSFVEKYQFSECVIQKRIITGWDVIAFRVEGQNLKALHPTFPTMQVVFFEISLFGKCQCLPNTGISFRNCLNEWIKVSMAYLQYSAPSPVHISYVWLANGSSGLLGTENTGTKLLSCLET